MSRSPVVHLSGAALAVAAIVAAFLVAGSRAPAHAQIPAGRHVIPGRQLTAGERAVTVAMRAVGHRYVLGARPRNVAEWIADGRRPPRTWDCSSLVWWSWFHGAGRDLTFGPGEVWTEMLWQIGSSTHSGAHARGWSRQATRGVIAPIGGYQPGDLLFFHQVSGIPQHVVIYAGAGMIVTATGAKFGIHYQSLRSFQAFVKRRHDNPAVWGWVRPH